jgi:hypothetical protein
MYPLHFAVTSWLAFLLLGQAAHAAPVITKQALQQDIDLVLTTVRERHPDLGFSTSDAAVTAALEAIGRDLPASVTRDEAWRQLARINPLLADEHLAIALTDWRGDTAAHRAAGGVLFPFDVAFDPQGRLVIDAALGGAASPLAGARIVAIDGVPADTLVASLASRVHGDTPAMRMALLAQRWWLYHWKTLGAAQQYRLVIERDGQRSEVAVPGSTDQPRMLQDEVDIARLYRLDTVPGCSAVLTVSSFDSAHLADFVAFTQAAFTRMRQEHIRHLVIDIRANAGGDDGMWLDGLMPYLATARYRTGSSAIKRVLRANPERGEQVGQIVHTQIATWREPQPDHPARFNGKVQVAIGPLTYSSSVLFANVMQDFGFATLVGTGGAARRSQSGGVYGVPLPQSGLTLLIPRFVLDPPGGASKGALLSAQAPWDPVAEPACPAR